MAQATTYKYSEMKILLGDGASPENFDAPCGLNSRALNRLKELTEINIPDCDDEDAPAWKGREVAALDWNVTGEGILAQEAVSAWEAFFDGTDARNIMIQLIGSLSGATKSWTGRCHLSTLNYTANRGEKVGIAVELQADGALVPVVVP